MGINRIDHVYVETTEWDESVDLWASLGFAFDEQWGSEGHRAGRLSNNEAVVVLAEVAADPAFSVFFGTSNLAAVEPVPSSVTTPLEDTHWGTRWVRVTDPDGRTFALEERP